MHAADRNTNCVQHNKTHVDKSARCRANSRPRTHTMTENGARVSEPRHVTETQNMSAGIQTPRSNMKQGTQTRERATRAHSKPRAHMKTRTWWEYQGSVTKPWITLDRSDRTLTLKEYVCSFKRSSDSGIYIQIPLNHAGNVGNIILNSISEINQ